MPRLFPNLAHKAKLSGQNQDFLAIAWLHLVVVRYEEPMLARIFGDEYDEYRKQAGRWLHLLRRQRPSFPRKES